MARSGGAGEDLVDGSVPLPGPEPVCYVRRMVADSKSLAAWLPGHDARWVIATVLVVAGLLWMKSDGLSRRIDDLNGRIGDLNGRIGDLNGRIDDLSRRLDDLRADVTRQIAEIRADLRRIDDRLRAVEIAVMPTAPDE